MNCQLMSLNRVNIQLMRLDTRAKENDDFGTCDDFTSSWYQLPTSH
jgi:hypothetical protein